MIKLIVSAILALSLFNLPCSKQSYNSYIKKQVQKQRNQEIRGLYAKEKLTKIKVLLQGISTYNDSLTVCFYELPLSGEYKQCTPTISQRLKVTNNEAEFSFIQESKVGYLSVYKDSIQSKIAVLPIIDLCPIESESEMVITLNYNSQYAINQLFDISAVGEGADVVNCYNALKKTKRKLCKGGLPVSPDLVYNKENHYNCIQKARLEILDSFKNKLPTDLYNLFRTDIIAECLASTIRYIELMHTGDSLSRAKSKKIYDIIIQDINLSEENWHNQSKHLSTYLLHNTILMGKLNSLNGKGNLDEALSFIITKYKGEVREKVITLFFREHYPAMNNIEIYLAKVEPYLKRQDFSSYLQSLTNNSNDKLAFNFELKNEAGSLVKLFDFKGKLIFMDYWFTGCIPCSQFYKNHLKQLEERYEPNNKVAFITVSIDFDERWKMGLASGDYTSNKAVNLYTNGQGQDHPIIKYYNIRAYPRPMMIGPNGRIINTGNINDFRSKEKIAHVIDSVLQKM